MMKPNIPDFLKEEYENRRKYLRNISMATMPDNPSANSYSASDFKRKCYEPILQLFDWFYDTKGDIETLYKNTIKVFKFDLSTYLIATGKVNTFTIVGNLESSTIALMEEYIEFERFKENVIFLNSMYKIVHSTIEYSIDKTKIVINGLGVNTSTIQIITFNAEVDLTDFKINGTLMLGVKDGISESEIKTIKDEIIEICNTKYVPKEDLRELSSFTDENGKTWNSLTENGFIELKTYN